MTYLEMSSLLTEGDASVLSFAHFKFEFDFCIGLFRSAFLDFKFEFEFEFRRDGKKYPRLRSDPQTFSQNSVSIPGVGSEQPRLDRDGSPTFFSIY